MFVLLGIPRILSSSSVVLFNSIYEKSFYITTTGWQIENKVRERESIDYDNSCRVPRTKVFKFCKKQLNKRYYKSALTPRLREQPRKYSRQTSCLTTTELSQFPLSPTILLYDPSQNPTERRSRTMHDRTRWTSRERIRSRTRTVGTC